MYAGVDIGGTKTAVILAGEDRIPFYRQAFPTLPADGWQKAVERVITEIDKGLAGCGGTAELRSVGVSCGGPLDSKRGLILSPPNLPTWDEVPIAELLSKRYGVPCRLQNDANACAVAEWMLGAGRGCESMAFLTMGTGMGAGLILNGRLYEGICGMAGEIGHIRLSDMGPVGYGKAGSFEGFCSGGGIAQLARTRVLEQLQRGKKVDFIESAKELETLTARAVGEAAENGSAFAAEILSEIGVWLGKGIAVLTDIINPEKVVIGSIYPRCRRFLEASCRETLDREALSANAAAVQIVPALLGESIGDCAAVCIAAGDGL